MLQVTENGANITLSGKTFGRGDGLFWFGFALLIGAVCVAMAMSLLPERFAIGALAILIVGSFIFNKLRSRQNQSDRLHISSGILKVQQGMFVHNLLGNTQRVMLQMNDNIVVKDTTLFIATAEGNIKCKISGFDTTKEAEVMQAILQGQQFTKRHANIKMQSS